MPYREALWITSIKVGDRDLGRFKSFEGAGADSDDGSYIDWDGEVPLGGRKTRDEATAKRLYREADHAIAHWLDSAINQPAVITRIPTGDDGVPWGDPIILHGLLKSVKFPNHDQASNDGGELELGFKMLPEMS